MQPVLGLPCDLLDLFAEAFLTLAQCPAEVGSMPVRPGRLPDDAPEVGVASLGDATTPRSLATGMFARYGTAVPHQLPRPGEAAQLTDFRHNRRGRDQPNAPQGLQGIDHGAHPVGDRRHRLIDGALETLDA